VREQHLSPPEFQEGSSHSPQPPESFGNDEEPSDEEIADPQSPTIPRSRMPSNNPFAPLAGLEEEGASSEESSSQK